MSIPVIGSLLVLVLFGIIIPAKTGVQPSKVMREWLRQPSSSFGICNDSSKGLFGIALTGPLDLHVCSHCHVEVLSSEVVYKWMCDGSGLHYLHDDCLLGFSALHGMDVETKVSLENLWNEYGSFLMESQHHPHTQLAQSLKVRASILEQIVGGVNPPGQEGVAVSRQDAADSEGRTWKQMSPLRSVAKRMSFPWFKRNCSDSDCPSKANRPNPDAQDGPFVAVLQRL